MNASLNTLISQFMSTVAGAPLHYSDNQPALLMTASLDSLINQLMPLKVLGASTAAALANTKLIEATVLSSLLSTSQDGGDKHKLLLSDGKQHYEITTKAAIKEGTNLHIRITADNQAVILKILANSHSAQHIAGTATQKTDIAASTSGVLTNLTGTQIAATNAQPGTTGTPNSDASIAQTKTALSQTDTTRAQLQTTLPDNVLKTPSSTESAINKHSTTAQDKLSNNVLAKHIVAQGIRQSLPQQEATHKLVSLLQQVLSQNTQPLSKPLTQGLTHLLRQFPTAEQLQQPASVKQAIKNSGVFLESKLAQLATAQLATTQSSTSSTINRASVRGELQTDIKAVLLHVSQLVEKTAATELKKSALNTTADIKKSSNENPPALLDLIKPLHSMLGQKNEAVEPEKNVDIILRQLGRQLLASIARTQLNQLENLGSKLNSTDSQSPSNSWVTEIPILHSKQVDNLDLRIEQELLEHDEKKSQKKQMLWTVMLAFDLHALGKLNVQLKILNKDVSATVWSSQQETHREVKARIKELSHSLEKVGVLVTDICCRHGTPPPSKNPLLQQLVDIRT